MTELNQTNNQNSKAIIHLTPSAVKKIKSMQERDGKAGYCLRIGVITGGCAGLSYDMRFQKSPYENDIVFEQEDITVIVNPESASFLQGINIDYIDTLNASGFQYSNPNAKSSCGCGTSFS